MSEDRTILLIGSGPIQIGQAAEFDYSGAQACRALQEEGARVVLVNSNPATIMTDPETADRVYIEPITPEAISEVIRIEEPDGVIAGLGGQTGLNVTAELAEGNFGGVRRRGDGDAARHHLRDGGPRPVPPADGGSGPAGSRLDDHLARRGRVGHRLRRGGLPRARAGRRRRSAGSPLSPGRRTPSAAPAPASSTTSRNWSNASARGSASRGTARCSSPSPSLAGSNWSTK